MIQGFNLDFNLRRLSATLVDHFVFAFVAGIIAFPGLVFDLITSPFGVRFHYGSLYLNTIAFAIYLSKDVIMPDSPGKKLFGLMLVSCTEEKRIRPYQLLLRNLTFFIWPIEVLMEWLRPEMRIGDSIARTKIIERNGNVRQLELSSAGRVFVFCLSIVLSYLIQLQVQRFIGYINEQLNN